MMLMTDNQIKEIANRKCYDMSDVTDIIDELLEAVKEYKAALEHEKIIGSIYRRASIDMFIDGAKWWEYHKTGATMWQSDQNLALEEAKRRYTIVPKEDANGR